MHFYNFFLKLYALKFIFYKIIKRKTSSNNIELNNNFDSLVVSISDNGEVVQDVNIDNNGCSNKEHLLVTGGILYFLFVLIMIGWQCIYSIVKSIVELDGRYLTSSGFSFLYVGQFIAGVIFYNGKFFNDIYYKTENYKTILLILFILASVISFLLTFTSIILLVNGYNLINYGHIYNNAGVAGRTLTIILMFFENFYSYNIFFVNIIVFASILHYQRVGVKAYLVKLGIIIDGNVQDMSVSSILEEFSKMQSHYKQTVRNMNLMFTSITIIGVVSSYFVLMNINTKFAGIFTYVDMGLFIAIEGIYLFTISQINDTKGDIRSLIGSSTFVVKFLNKNSLNPVYGDIYEEGVVRGDVAINIERERERDNIKQPSLNRRTTVNLMNTRQENNRIIMDTYETINDRNIDEGGTEKKIDLIKNMTFRSIIISNQNGISIDWLVLYNKLSENWQPFKLFSYDIDDAQIIQKLVVIILGFSAILRLNFKVGF